jgi:hypothetical protein
VFSDWIEESQEDFEKLFKDTITFLEGYIEDDLEVDTKPLLLAIEKSVDVQKIRFQALLGRIKKKQSEINSLRDGVSSQTVQFSTY